jgi:hypothetical protein
MGFDIRLFLEELQYKIDEIHNGQEDELIEWLLEQIEYAKECGVID